MKTAFIIGNGETRRGFDLTRLKPYGTIFGCNALYRDYYPEFEVPDYLVAIDNGMIREIEQQEQFSSARVIIPPEDERWEPAECNRARPRSNAGINAMREAIKMGYNQLICLGFDFLILDEDISTSNIYNNTANYGNSTRAVYHENVGRANYLNWLVGNHPEVDFIFIFPEVLTKGKIYSNISGSNVYVNSYENLEIHT